VILAPAKTLAIVQIVVKVIPRVLVAMVVLAALALLVVVLVLVLVVLVLVIEMPRVVIVLVLAFVLFVIHHYRVTRFVLDEYMIVWILPK
jgi:hypothetical protein